MLKTFIKFFGGLFVIFLEGILRIIYLSLPLWFFVMMLQLRKKVDVLPALNGYISENSTWHAIYDGVVLVNSNPGALEKRIKRIKQWFADRKVMWIVLAVLILLGLLGLIAYRLYK